MTKQILLFGCGGCLALLAIPLLIITGACLYDAYEPVSLKEEAYAEDFVDSDIISPRPATMVRYKTLDFHEGNIAGDADSCIAAYTLRSEDFELILKAHKWVTPKTFSAVNEFRETWPSYKGEIESYYYDVGDASADLSGRSTVMAVSKDHTKLVFSTCDAWARPFESAGSEK